MLTRRYRRVEIVFIRHTDHAEEVDEQTFFYGTASGGTLVSSALETMSGIVKTRFRPGDWNIYAAQVSDGDNPYSDGETTSSLLRNAILPAVQYFAYLEVGEPAGSFAMPDSALWNLPGAIRRGRSALHSQGEKPQRNFSGSFAISFRAARGGRSERNECQRQGAVVRRGGLGFPRSSAKFTMHARKSRTPNLV